MGFVKGSKLFSAIAPVTEENKKYFFNPQRRDEKKFCHKVTKSRIRKILRIFLCDFVAINLLEKLFV